MRYTVVWQPLALATLANLWLQVVDKQAVTDASDRLDAALRNDPAHEGPQVGSFFVRNDFPLAVLYQVDPGDRMVRVLTVKEDSLKEHVRECY